MRRLTVVGVLSLAEAATLFAPHEPEQLRIASNRLLTGLQMEVQLTVWELGRLALGWGAVSI